MPGDRSREGRILDLQAARFGFPMLHRPSGRQTMGGTSERGHPDLISNPRRHRGSAFNVRSRARDSSRPVVGSSSGRGTTPDRSLQASCTIHHPPGHRAQGHAAHELCTPARLSHLPACLPARRRDGQGRRANELSLPCHVVALDVQSQIRSGSAARTVCSVWRG